MGWAGVFGAFFAHFAYSDGIKPYIEAASHNEASQEAQSVWLRFSWRYHGMESVAELDTTIRLTKIDSLQYYIELKKASRTPFSAVKIFSVQSS